MNDNGCFEVPIPIAIVLGALLVCFLVLVIFYGGMTVGMKAGLQHDSAKCAATTQQKAQHE